MDKSNNDSQNNISKQDINNDKDNDKIILPKINKDLIPLQNNISVNKMNSYDKGFNYKKRLNGPAFLTLRKLESKKMNLYKSNNNIENENYLIHKLLKEKIEINNNKNKCSLTYKNLKNKLRIYIDEASLYKNSIFIHREKKNLKEVKVSKLLTLSNAYKSKYNNCSDNNKNTIDLRVYKDKNLYEDKSKRLKTLDKKYIKNENSEYIPNNWRKKINCGLKYKYDKNKESIDEITLKIKKIDNIVKVAFDGFKNETDDIFNEIMNNSQNKNKKK